MTSSSATSDERFRSPVLGRRSPTHLSRVQFGDKEAVFIPSTCGNVHRPPPTCSRSKSPGQLRFVRSLELAHLACQRAHARERPARRPLPVARVALSRLRHADYAMQLGGRKQHHNQGDNHGGEHSAAYVAERSCTCPVRPPVLGPALTSQAWAGISASARPGHRYARSRSPCRRSAYLRPRSAAYEVQAAATPWISRPTG